VSCSLHHLLCELKYDAPRELFDDRPAHLMRLLDAEAQASHLVYEYLNTSAAGLVSRPEHMPGPVLDFDLWKVGYIEVERPPVYFDKSRPERLQLIVTPPPELYLAFDGDIDRLVYHMNKLAEDGLRAVRAEQKGPVLGARRVRELHPWSEPRTLRESGGGRVPTFRIGARGLVGRVERIGAAKEVHSFRSDHEECRVARRDGDHERRFPFGTYAWRAYHGAPVETAPLPGAIIARPGPVLCDVQAELDRERRARDEVRDESHAIVDAVRQAFVEEAVQIVEEATLDLAAPTPHRPPRDKAGKNGEKTDNAASDGAGEPAGDERDPAVVRHRFDKRRVETARRIITLRDRRRGRPPRGSGSHGSDPPG